jgi:hypothetical protein
LSWGFTARNFSPYSHTPNALIRRFTARGRNLSFSPRNIPADLARSWLSDAPTSRRFPFPPSRCEKSFRAFSGLGVVGDRRMDERRILPRRKLKEKFFVLVCNVFPRVRFTDSLRSAATEFVSDIWIVFEILDFCSKIGRVLPKQHAVIPQDFRIERRIER